MGRAAGAKNRNTPNDYEGEFLQTAITEYNYWRSIIKIAEAGEDKDKAREYAEAYKVLINKFSQLESE